MSYLQIFLPQHCGRACYAFTNPPTLFMFSVAIKSVHSLTYDHIFPYVPSQREVLGGLDVFCIKKKGAVWFHT